MPLINRTTPVSKGGGFSPLAGENYNRYGRPCAMCFSNHNRTNSLVTTNRPAGSSLSTVVAEPIARRIGASHKFHASYYGWWKLYPLELNMDSSPVGIISTGRRHTWLETPMGGKGEVS